MASSSSSSHSTPASSSQSWNHDVFLSFRGEDTRKTFVDHLYSALVQQGIHTYKDDETLPRGELIGRSLLKAIKASQIAVIVLSENYADSSWCLDELAYIMKCKDKRGQIVMPIFYDVDPSEVRKQKRKYGEAFAKHESENNNKVESWRKALVDVGNISGWEPKHIANGHESKCIEVIVETISHRLCLLISSANDEDLVGMEARVQDLKSKLETESRRVLMAGIWGVGGGGKTTLASSIYDEISSKFDGCCFVKNIREESSKYGLEKLQEKILSDVLKQKQMEVKRVEEGRRLIKSRFCHKKVLIVLDDVDHLDHLKELAGSHDWFGEGSRIIITTRDNHFLYAQKVNVIYNVSLLNDDEAIKLFHKHAPRDYRPIEDYEMLSKEVVSYARGLPLALKVLGSFLCDKDMNEWMSALARLKEIPDTDIMEKLKISYDGLKPVEKGLFLDIVCFFRRYSKDNVMEILDACGFHAVIGIKVLIQKALITVSDGIFDMHDLIQEMGHYIVRGEHPNNPEKHSRIWLKEDILKISAMDATTENEAVLMDNSWQSPPRGLRQAIANMKKLRWISLSGFSASSLPTKFQPTKLCYLKLRGSFQKQIWEVDEHLPSLKVLDLSGSFFLIMTPNFNGLPCLERMIFARCGSLKEVHPSIGYHERLIFLNMDGCSNLELFPPIIRMKKLETLKLSGCSRLCKFPEIQMNMDSLVKLCLRNSGIEVVPSSIGQYCTNLLSLDLRECTHLKSIEGNFRLLKRLKKLLLMGCERLEIPTQGLFDVECCVEMLSLYTMPQAPSSVSVKFPHLTRLSFRSSNLVDGDIPSDICQLSNLQELDLSENKFSRLHFSLSQLPRLKFLNLSKCKSLVELPDLPPSIAILNAYGCDSLEIVGDFPTTYKWLWKVTLRRKNKLIGVEKVLQSILQGNAIEDYFMSLDLGYVDISRWSYEWQTFRLQLPLNWYNDFSGFLILVEDLDCAYTIVIKQETHMDYQPPLDRIVRDTPEAMCYISFGSLRHTSWWNSTYSTISFFLVRTNFKVELVPRKSKGDSMERAKGTTNCSEFWDEEVKDRKTFTIKRDSKSSVETAWRHHLQ